MLDEHRDDGRHIERGRQQVIGERRVAHEAVAEKHLLHHREPEALRDPTFDLAHDRDGVDRFPDILRGRDLHDLHESGVHIDVDDGAVSREEERNVALVLRLGAARLGVAMPVCDRPIDGLLQEGSEIVRRASRLARAGEELGLDLATCGEHRAAGHPCLPRRG